MGGVKNESFESFESGVGRILDNDKHNTMAIQWRLYKKGGLQLKLGITSMSFRAIEIKASSTFHAVFALVSRNGMFSSLENVCASTVVT